MLEIAVSLGVIAIAMVAILGVLPSGLNVQKDNRERTFINEDARMLIDALREGNEGLSSLTNHVEAILRVGTNLANNITTNYLILPNNHFDAAFIQRELGNPSGQFVSPTNSPLLILSALSTPEGTLMNTKSYFLYRTVALMRSFSGGMLEQVEGSSNDLSFHYYLTLEVTPFTGFYLTNDIVNAGTGNAEALQSLFRQLQVNVLATNVHELRLTFAWPVLPNGRVGLNRQTYRSLISGIPQQAIFPALKNNEGLFYLFQSQKYQLQPNPAF